MKGPHLAAAFLLLILAAGCTQNGNELQPSASPLNSTAIMPDGSTLSLELSSAPAQIAEGLSGRASLCGECGMLFIYPQPEPRSFWMHGMLFPLDIIFLDENYTAVRVEENAQPCSAEQCPLILSGSPAQYVLEVNAGFAEKHGLRDGAIVKVIS